MNQISNRKKNSIAQQVTHSYWKANSVSKSVSSPERQDMPYETNTHSHFLSFL